MARQGTGNFLYDLTREMRRLALSGRLETLYPDRSPEIESALTEGRRILFAPDDEEFYVEYPMDRILLDSGTGRAIGARRL